MKLGAGRTDYNFKDENKEEPEKFVYSVVTNSLGAVFLGGGFESGPRHGPLHS